MPQINLLPWREELRTRRQKEFGVLALVAVVLMGGVVAGVHFYYEGLIQFQSKRNEFLDKEIKKLNKQIAEIETLQKEKERLIARTEKIQQLQSGRPDVVHLMDAIVSTLPEGVYYTRIQQQAARLKIAGIAQSNARVSTLMRQLEASDWLEKPQLEKIEAQRGKSVEDELVRNSTFSLTVNQSKKKAPAEDEKG